MMILIRVASPSLLNIEYLKLLDSVESGNVPQDASFRILKELNLENKAILDQTRTVSSRTLSGDENRSPLYTGRMHGIDSGVPYSIDEKVLAPSEIHLIRSIKLRNADILFSFLFKSKKEEVPPAGQRDDEDDHRDRKITARVLRVHILVRKIGSGNQSDDADE